MCGAKLILNPDIFMHSSKLGFLNPSKRCRSFNTAENSYSREEALALLLKSLKQAVRNNNPVRVISQETQLNQNKQTRRITLSSSNAQKDNIHTLYSQLKLSLSKIQYVEAHSTGTAADNPLEISAINSVRRRAKKTYFNYQIGQK